jgi:hypothetical protein
MIALIDAHRDVHGVEPICKVLPIAPSTHHAHVARRADPSKASARARRDAALRLEIERVWTQNIRVFCNGPSMSTLFFFLILISFQATFCCSEFPCIPPPGVLLLSAVGA